MIFEYLPLNPCDDRENIAKLCSFLPITKILIPANPAGKIYPDSIIVATYLQNLLRQYPTTSHLECIPTIKTNIHTLESIQSIFLSLQYTNLTNIAIISGDTTPFSTKTHTLQALQTLQEIKKENPYLQKLQIFCALPSSLSHSTTQSLYDKLKYGVRYFITQPFYTFVSESCNSNDSNDSSKSYKSSDLSKSSISESNKSSQVTFSQFLHFYQAKASHFLHSHLCDSNTQEIRFYCGFFPLFSHKQASLIANKNLGIHIPNSYIAALQENPMQCNAKIFHAIKHHNVSMGYINLQDIQDFIAYLVKQKYLIKNIHS